MSDPPPRDGEAGARPLRFAHRAMACAWEFLLICDDARYAEEAAAAAGAEIDRLEAEISRFVPTSDVSRLNAAPPGTPVLIGADAFEVLALAERVREATAGAFDVSIGALVPRGGEDNEYATVFDTRTAPPNEVAAAAPSPASTRPVELDRASRTATRGSAAVVIDLGAIGKGFAVDAAVAVLRAWGMAGGIVSSGQSTALAFGAAPAAARGWTVALRDPRDHARELALVTLRDEALSGSGVALHGRHIIDPRTGRPADGPAGAWAIAASGALSDAVSTALMILAPDEARSCLGGLPEVAGFVFDADAGGVTPLSPRLVESPAQR